MAASELVLDLKKIPIPICQQVLLETQQYNNSAPFSKWTFTLQWATVQGNIIIEIKNTQNAVAHSGTRGVKYQPNMQISFWLDEVTPPGH